MSINVRTFVLRVSAVVGALLLTACGNLSQVSKEGTTDTPVWPNPDQSLTFHSGSYPTVESLALVGAGMTKDQLYNLLGRPHFNEGFLGVREWDYLFHFRTPEGIKTCQYKVLFDNDMLAQSFFWKPANCLTEPLEPTERTEVAFSLNGDVLFAFASATLTPAGQNEVARVAQQLKQAGNVDVAVVGHTDVIGSASDNQRLSERRAASVRSALISNGVTSRITASGVGDTQPIVQCNTPTRAEQIACLQPNRRVTITAIEQ